MPPSRFSRRVLRALSRRGALEVLAALSQGPVRFSDLEVRLGITPRTLSERLREFVALGLVQRKAFAEVPPRVEYALTLRGRKIIEFFERMDSIWEEEG